MVKKSSYFMGICLFKERISKNVVNALQIATATGAPFRPINFMQKIVKGMSIGITINKL